MPRATNTAKPQTVPLGNPGSNTGFLQLRGSFKVGPGDPVEDIWRARRRMGLQASQGDLPRSSSPVQDS